jgi:hypothetical protein
LSIPGQLEGFGGVFIGIYTYVECPKGKESDLGTWLEMYRNEVASAPLMAIRFDPPDLTHESLIKASDAFLAKFKDLKTAKTGVTVSG